MVRTESRSSKYRFPVFPNLVKDFNNLKSNSYTKLCSNVMSHNRPLHARKKTESKRPKKPGKLKNFIHVL